MTALLDAVGSAINETGEPLAKMDEHDRPGLVVFVVMTNGEENSSKEFSKADIKAMLQRQQDTYNWHFTFLGAKQDAFAEASGMGIAAAGVANFAMDKMVAAYAATGERVWHAEIPALHGSSAPRRKPDQRTTARRFSMIWRAPPRRIRLKNVTRGQRRVVLDVGGPNCFHGAPAWTPTCSPRSGTRSDSESPLRDSYDLPHSIAFLLILTEGRLVTNRRG